MLARVRDLLALSIALKAPPPSPARRALLLSLSLSFFLSFSLSLSLSLRAAYYILDELFIGGELQETNKREVMRVVVAHEALARQESDLAAGLFE